MRVRGPSGPRSVPICKQKDNYFFTYGRESFANRVKVLQKKAWNYLKNPHTYLHNLRLKMTIETLNQIIEDNAEAADRGDEMAQMQMEWATQHLIELQKLLGKLPSQTLKQKDGSTFENPDPIVF